MMQGRIRLVPGDRPVALYVKGPFGWRIAGTYTTKSNARRGALRRGITIQPEPESKRLTTTPAEAVWQLFAALCAAQAMGAGR